MGNRDLILAGINGSGAGGNSLAYFAPEGTVAPTDTATDPAAAWLDAGWITEDGLSAAVAETSTDIPAFGTFSPVRTIITESTQTFEIAFLESNPVSLAVYHRLPLDDASLDPDSLTGALDFTTGPARRETYSALFDLVDGDNAVRAYCPNVEVTDRGDLNIRSGEAVTYPVTLTAFPDENGVAVHWFYLLGALGTGAFAAGANGAQLDENGQQQQAEQNGGNGEPVVTTETAVPVEAQPPTGPRQTTRQPTRQRQNAGTR